MSTASPPPSVERARPLLGTYVSIRVGGLADPEAHAAIDRGFEVIAAIHDLMSFHERVSELSRLNREAAQGPVAVSSHTYEVLRRGLEISRLSDGAFDMTVGRELVAWGYLPRPEGAPEPDSDATWRDIELLDGGCVRFRRPLWLDLGGIAKGYAVDCAVQIIMAAGAASTAVNAGGDLRVAGPISERVLLRTAAPGDTVPVLEIEGGSIASSSGREHKKRYGDRDVGPHVHGLKREAMGVDSFVSVVAEECIMADALTKVVLARGPDADTLLRELGAAAYLQTAGGDWQVMGRGTE